MDRLTPQLENWLREQLTSLGLPNPNSGDKEAKDHTTKGVQRGGGRRTAPTPPVKDKIINPETRRGGERATAIPNKELFSAVAGGGTGTTAQTLRPRDGLGNSQELWQEAKGRKKRKKPPSTLPRCTPEQGLRLREASWSRGEEAPQRALPRNGDHREMQR